MFDLTNMSAHAIVDRKERIDFIERTIGFGKPVVVTKRDRDINGDAVTVLTSTGVVVIEVEETREIITAFIATVRQAQGIWHRAKGNQKMNKRLWNIVNYNNNTETYKKICGLA